MDVKNTIVDKFMKSPQDEIPDTLKKENDTSSEIANIPDEFTAKLTANGEEKFPSIHDVDEEELKNFVYLDNDELSRDFLIDRDLTKQYTIQLVMYHMNTALDLPFLEFYLERSSNSYSFPEKTLDNQKLEGAIEEINNTQQGGMEITTEQRGDIEMGVKTTIIENTDINPFEQQIFELFNKVTGYSDIIAENAYKGFVEDKNIIYVLFENKEKVIQNNDTDENHMWVILDEVMKQSVLNIPIEGSVCNLFLEHTKLAHISSEGTNTDIPIVVYAADKVNDIYENIYYSSENTDETYLITIPIDSNEYGHMFLFTNTILPSNQDVNSIKRMVIFTQKALYMLTKPTKDLFDKHPIIRFKEDDLTFWGISNYLLFTELL
jgi:hypothetical protein